VASRAEWWLLAATGVVALPLWFASRGSPIGRGDVVDVAVTVVPEDATRLSCEQAWAFERYSCEYEAGARRFSPPPAPEDRIQPFVSLDRAVYLVPGLFAEAHVAKLASAIPRTQRFTARCKLRLLARTHDARIRFQQGADWEAPKEPLWIAAPESCITE
jgi:hypothetical protein